MNNTLLVETLKLLSPIEMKEFARFVQSEFHNAGKSRDEILRLFYCVEKAYPSFEQSKTQKEVIYPVVFPNMPEFAGKLEKLIGELYKLLKDYLLWKNYQSKEEQFVKALDWVKVLRKLKDNLNYETALSRLEKEVLGKAQQAPAHYFQRFQLEMERQEWMSKMNKGRDDLNINKTLTSLYTFYEIYRLELLNLLLLQQKITQFEIPPLVQNYINIGLNSGLEDSNIVIVRISSKIYNLLQQETPQLADFESLMDELSQNEHIFAPETLQSYFAYLRNFCTILINAGHLDLQIVQFRLYKDNLTRGYLYFEGQLHTSTLANITRVAIVTGHVSWALECIESHKDKMFGDVETADYYMINKSLCLFEQKNYEAALGLLPPTSPNIIYHLIARRLELMCYYELKSELLYNKMEAFKVYIWRASEKLLSDALQDANKTFINLLLQLASIPKGDQKKLDRLEKRIQEKKQVAELRWLIAKIREH